MSEYEMASLHIELYNAIQASLTVFLTVLSGFLIASYFAAHRLDRFTGFVALTVFIGFSLLNISGTGGTLRSYARLAREMRAFAERGRGLAWHSTRDIPLPVVDALEPLWTLAG